MRKVLHYSADYCCQIREVAEGERGPISGHEAAGWGPSHAGGAEVKTRDGKENGVFPIGGDFTWHINKREVDEGVR
jgi:hypothetical protein